MELERRRFATIIRVINADCRFTAFLSPLNWPPPGRAMEVGYSFAYPQLVEDHASLETLPGIKGAGAKAQDVFNSGDGEILRHAEGDKVRRDRRSRQVEQVPSSSPSPRPSLL